MSKIKKKNSSQNKKRNPILEFFFPKDFNHQLKRGLYLGTHSKYAPNTETGQPGLLFYLPFRFGKLIRKIYNFLKGKIK